MPTSPLRRKFNQSINQSASPFPPHPPPPPHPMSLAISPPPLFPRWHQESTLQRFFLSVDECIPLLWVKLGCWPAGLDKEAAVGCVDLTPRDVCVSDVLCTRPVHHQRCVRLELVTFTPSAAKPGHNQSSFCSTINCFNILSLHSPCLIHRTRPDTQN